MARYTEKRTKEMVERFMKEFKDFRPLNGPLADEVDDGTGFWPDTGERKDPSFGWNKEIYVVLLEDGRLQVESEFDIDNFKFNKSGIKQAKKDIEQVMTDLGMYEE